MQSFEELFSQYFGKVYRFALKLTRSREQAEEITQQTFYKALKKIDSFQGRSDAGTWLCSIAKNEYFNRKTRNREQAFEPGSTVFGAADGDVAEKLQREQERMQIHRHLHELDEPWREVFMLRVFGELTYAQIASLFGRTENWARVTFYRAKIEIQKRMEEDEHE